jgi:hypothetical protein
MDHEVESFRRFIFGTIEKLVEQLAGLSEEDLNWRPDAPETNSLYMITTHILANAEENILGVLCERPVRRVRDDEFAARGVTWKPLHEDWLALRERIDAAFETLPAGDLDRVRQHPRRGPLAGREILLVVARHAAEHWGEAQLTSSLLRARRSRTPRSG